jgi:hypothetical protein
MERDEHRGAQSGRKKEKKKEYFGKPTSVKEMLYSDEDS